MQAMIEVYVTDRQSYDRELDACHAVGADFTLRLIDGGHVKKWETRIYQSGRLVKMENSDGELEKVLLSGGKIVYHGWVAPRRKNIFPKRLDFQV